MSRVQTDTKAGCAWIMLNSKQHLTGSTWHASTRFAASASLVQTTLLLASPTAQLLDCEPGRAKWSIIALGCVGSEALGQTLAEWSHELRRQLQGKHAVIDTKVTFGAPGAACVHVADAAKVDMVVMAVHGQTDAHSLVMGPVSQFVSTFLKRCPVVLVRDGATENDDVEGDAGVSAKSAVAHAPAGVVA
ncbi:hypothetical protein BC831DRAFT_439428 [Entophlyctis helioformis]|nr:hypothetical protein BC831DRAFT_439428 [Entophlyctis helioformis]